MRIAAEFGCGPLAERIGLSEFESFDAPHDGLPGKVRLIAGAMSSKPSSSQIDIAAARLRSLAMATPDGELLGSEDDVIGSLGVSRITARQAARLLEREGVLTVKRGKHGGYFAARPSGDMIETVVCSYMNTLGLSTKHTGMVATSLWIEALREAAGAERAAALAMVDELSPLFEDLDPEATLEEVSKLEQRMRAAVFKLIDGAYIDLIFRINAAFARQRLTGWTEQLDADLHRRFVRKWKAAKLMELEGIADGNVLQAVTAAMHERSLWVGRGGGKWKDEPAVERVIAENSLR
ncbi:regulatory GntR family protein [Novosphingobium sp. ST904]|nr:regulatory GntR family protein [Novosphingobium sp. ST904]